MSKNARISLPIFLLFLTGLLFFSCNDSQRKAKDLPISLSSYVYAYTSGEISKTAPIRLRFTNNLASEEQIGQEVEKDLISFRPKIKGKAIWEDLHTIFIQPEEHLQAKKTYVATVNLVKVYPDVPKDARTFEFDFQVKEQNFSVRFDGLHAADPSDSQNQILVGNVYTYDYADTKEVQKLLTAKLDGQQPSIRWEHDANQKNHRFYIEKIARTNSDAQLAVNWNGSPLGVKSVKDEKTFLVPSLNNFQVLDAEVVQDNDQYLLIYFSDPLMKAQSLEGMIRISDYGGKLRFNIDGNQLRVYPATRLNGERTITIERGLKNTRKVKMTNRIQETLIFEEPQPNLRLVGRGVIIPDSDGLIFPFEAINLNAVDVEVFKVYDNNILQFLQTNEMNGEYEMERVGRIVLQKQVSLSELNPDANRTAWTRYALDLSSMLAQDPNSIYQIRLGFRPAYTDYFCGKASTKSNDGLEVLENTFDNNSGEIESIWNAGYYGIDGYYSGYEYRHRQDPCFSAYYNTSRFVRRNVIASNLGIIAKSSDDGTMLFFVNDLRTTKPVSGIRLEVFDYQQQLIRSVQTNGEGIAAIDLDRKPFVVVANRGDEKGYLRLMDPNALSLSKFDVSGSVSQKGIKGYIYGERGVWRPGDSLYLNFVLEDNSGKLPANHPISFELFDARNQLQQQFTTSQNVNNVYPLPLATAADAPTGDWRAVVKLGGASFSKTLKIETVKPNRLKLKLDFAKESLSRADMPLNTDLQVNWLHGAPARNLKAKVEMKLRPVNTSFKKYPDFEFDDPARVVDASYETIFDGAVNDQGTASLKMDFGQSGLLPGKMRADYRVRAFEKGGDFSEDNFSKDYHPYDSYAGVSIPKNRYGSKRIDLEKGGTISFATVDSKGEPLRNRNVKVGLYRVEWSWWWESDNSNISSYNTSTHYNALETIGLNTDDKGNTTWNIKVNDWGRYMVRVCDEESGHCSGEYFYAGSPWWGDDSDGRNRQAAAMLRFNSDKKKYAVGEEVELRIPSSAGGRALVSIESGDRVIESYWRDTKAEETVVTFVASEEMTPTVYAHVTLLQPHGQVKNDLPIRMYGVIPIAVEDPKTRLKPTLKMADVLQPEGKVNIEVRESAGQAMAYTVAVVDDGLLDLTRFKTPNPWDVFYAREALGVKTWDVYDHVLGALGGQLDRLLSIGGDAAAVDKGGSDKANRFKPVVKHFGPFYLEKGKKASHEFIMPNYVGSVRTMIVASNQGAYGSAEKTTPVRKPLMVLATLPRVLGPKERLKVPVNVFAMEKKVKEVTVKIEETTGLINFLGSNQKTISFNSVGDEIVEFEIEVPERIGVARFKVTATGGGEKASQEIEIDIRNPNPLVTDIYAEVLENGNQWTKNISPTGVRGTNTATLEVSNIPPLNLDHRMRYLLRYPHGCVEQTTSSVFPQLYVGEMIELEDKKQGDITYNVKAGIDRLKRFQTNDGGFAYWPGERETSNWGTNYAGHFLLEAKKLGYPVSSIMMNRWQEYQSRIAKRWVSENNNGYHAGNDKLGQAYRLYTLALNGTPELGAMNRLREHRDLPITAKWRLAAAYALAGKPEVANQMITNLSRKVASYTELSYTYGSSVRDEAMILETLVLLGRTKEAASMAKTISDQMNTENWYSTQSTAYCLLAMGKFVAKNDLAKGLKYAYQVDGSQMTSVGSKKAISFIDLDLNNGARTVAVSNTSGGILYAKLVVTGQPAVGDQTESSSNLVLDVSYKTTDGQLLNPSQIAQGTDFIAEVKVRNPGTKGRYYKEMALSQIFPSGWEIMNTRLSNVQNYSDTNTPTYQDIRDDRVYSYFDVGNGNTKTYRVQLNAAYQGRYYLPSVSCEAMYDNEINARKPGQWVEVTSPEGMTF